MNKYPIARALRKEQENLRPVSTRFSQCERRGVGATNAHINWGEKACFPWSNSQCFCSV